MSLANKLKIKNFEWAILNAKKIMTATVVRPENSEQSGKKFFNQNSKSKKMNFSIIEPKIVEGNGRCENELCFLEKKDS